MPDHDDPQSAEAGESTDNALNIHQIRTAIDEGERSGEYKDWNFNDFMERAKKGDA
ncbi:type II toxin-antitoxin system ParD family antitoxin [Agarilytica rhodophyticola]|uniref:type II toxin-antitoxin system ParD family antitoxin n=1 Tax=Agarilytica rhodophyticola TaxID=1737490 RepID=UPI00131A39D1|nr:hypothetical protein [Agarilytica rhodophyticola]